MYIFIGQYTAQCFCSGIPPQYGVLSRCPVLITNRRGDFDEVFRSRIQLQIPYAEPDKDRRAIIWKNLLNDQNVEHNLSEGTIQRLGHELEDARLRT